MVIAINPIGRIYSKYQNTENGGRQPTIDGLEGHIVLNPEYLEGLQGLQEFSHIIALYYFHRQAEVRLKACPCFDKTTEHGIFASRYPTRPNHIGMSIWSLKAIQGNVLYCHDIDVIDGTPLIDIKPYVYQFDHRDMPRCGWYDHIDWENIQQERNRADNLLQTEED